MPGRCLNNFSNGCQLILLVVLMLGPAACSTLHPPEKEIAFSPPDINQRTVISGKGCPPFADSDRLALEEGVANVEEAAGNVVDPLCPPGDGLGIKISGIRWSAAGYMLHFRYTVINPAEALPMFDQSVIPYLVHEKSGARFMVPSPAKLGPFRTTGALEKGRYYFMMFANPGRYVQPGDLVTVVVGEHRFEHLAVQE